MAKKKSFSAISRDLQMQRILQRQKTVFRDKAVFAVSGVITALAILAAGGSQMAFGLGIARLAWFHAEQPSSSGVALAWVFFGAGIVAVGLTLLWFVVKRSFLVLRDILAKRFPYLNEEQIDAGLLLLDALPMSEDSFRTQRRLSPGEADEVVRLFVYFDVIYIREGVVEHA